MLGKEPAEAGETPDEEQETSGDQGGPEPETTPLEGKTTLDDDVALESAILAYNSLSRIADEIARSLRAGNVRQVVILNPPDTAGLLDLRWVAARAEAIRQAFEAIPPQEPAAKEAVVAAVGAAVTTATVLLKSVLDLAALFRSDVAIKTGDITLEEGALVAELARQLQPETKLFYPQVLPFDFVAPATLQKSRIAILLEDLQAAQQAAERTAAEKDKEALEDAKAAFQALREDLLEVDSESGTTLLSRLVRAELLENRLKDEGSHLLYLKIVKAGGDKRTVNNRFRFKDSISFSGGAVVTYMLFAKDGSVASSQTLYFHSGARKFAQGNKDEFPLSNF